MEPRPFKTAVYDQLAQVGRALSSGPRLELLDLLAQGPRTVEALAQGVAQSVANTSHHLQALKRAGLVAAEREGVHVRYRLADPAVAALLEHVRAVATAQLAEVDRLTRTFFDERDGLEAIGLDELVDRVREGDAVLLDVRPAPEFAAGHLPGARSIPLDELERRLDEVPADRPVIAYCRGPYCAFSADAVRLLRAHGRRAVRADASVTAYDLAAHARAPGRA